VIQGRPQQPAARVLFRPAGQGLEFMRIALQVKQILLLVVKTENQLELSVLDNENAASEALLRIHGICAPAYGF